jgi:hypothetical protein
LGCLCVCLCLVSCSNKYGEHPPYPTTGQLKVNGKPAAGARVVFHHVADWGEKSIVPQGFTDEHGRFELSTYGVHDGAPAGEYRVAVEWPAYRRGKNVGPDLLGGKFKNPKTSGLTARVGDGPTELEPIDLKAEVPDIGPGQGPARRSRRSGR